MAKVERTTRQLFRDCIRLANHIGGKSAKGDSLRREIRFEFKRNLGVKDPKEIEELKGCASQALANYLVVYNMKGMVPRSKKSSPTS